MGIEEMVRRFAPLVYGAARRATGSDHAAEDVSQAVFLLLVRRGAAGIPEEKLPGWLYRTTILTAGHHLREERRRTQREKEAAVMVSAGGEAAGAAVMAQLDAALAGLPGRYREPVVLHYLGGLGQEDAARQMGLAPEAFRQRLSRAIEKLRAKLAGRGAIAPAAAIVGALTAQVEVPAEAVGRLVATASGTAGFSAAAAALAKGAAKIMFWMKVKLAAAVLGGALVVGGGGGALAVKFTRWGGLAASAGEPSAPAVGPAAASADKVLPELAPDPKVMALINGLGDNSSVELPPIKTVGDWTAATKAFGMEKTGPVGRDFCMKAAWMPDRKRAFFCGVNHGSPHRFNDAWEYDLPSNTWVMLHPPDETWNDKIYETRDVEYKDADGKTAKTKWVFTRNGGVACGSHTWGGLTYDPNAKAAIWVPAHYAGMSGRQWLEKQGLKDVYQGSVAWAYYPYRRAWQPVLGDKPWPKLNEGGFLEFVPELNMCVWNLNNWSADGTWGYDSRSNRWKKLHDVGPDVPKWALACYAQDSKTVVAQDTGKNTFHFDVQTLKWKKVLSPGADSNEAPYGADWCGAMFYDPVNKVCLTYNTPSGQGEIKNPQEAVWSYSVADRKWTKHLPNGPGYSAIKGARATSYFDPERNVLVINAAEKTWLYRYKRAPEQK